MSPNSGPYRLVSNSQDGQLVIQAQELGQLLILHYRNKDQNLVQEVMKLLDGIECLKEKVWDKQAANLAFARE
jgi:hypothetical protein